MSKQYSCFLFVSFFNLKNNNFQLIFPSQTNKISNQKFIQ
ncbi:hypothetical protein pb186bvf_002439 [Paramecium bursaria]